MSNTHNLLDSKLFNTLADRLDEWREQKLPQEKQDCGRSFALLIQTGGIDGLFTELELQGHSAVAQRLEDEYYALEDTVRRYQRFYVDKRDRDEAYAAVAGLALRFSQHLRLIAQHQAMLPDPDNAEHVEERTGTRGEHLQLPEGCLMVLEELRKSKESILIGDLRNKTGIGTRRIQYEVLPIIEKRHAFVARPYGPNKGLVLTDAGRAYLDSVPHPKTI